MGSNDKKITIPCLFAIVCVATLLSTSLIVLATNSDNDSGSCNGSRVLDESMFVDTDGCMVAVYDENREFIGEKEIFGERIPSNTEFDAGGLTYETHSGNTLWVLDYDGGYRDIVVPDRVNYKGEAWTVTKIGDWGLTSKSAFARHPHSVEIGSTVDTLGAHCFSDEFCAGDHLTGFRIRDIEQSKLTTIKEEAFYNTEIKSIELPKSLQAIEQKAFKRCDVEKVTLHSEKLDIGMEAFCRSDVKYINLENVRHIGKEAFYKTELIDIDLSSATHIGKNAFYGWVNNTLHSVKFSSELAELDDEAFGTWLLLPEVIFPVTKSYHFYDTHHTEMGQCAELMRGKTFVRIDGQPLEFIQVL